MISSANGKKRRDRDMLHCTLQSLSIVTSGFPRNAHAIRDKNKPPSRKRNLLSRTRPTVLSSMPHTPLLSAHVVYLSPFTTKNAAYYMSSTLPTTINFHTNRTIKAALDGETLWARVLRVPLTRQEQPDTGSLYGSLPIINSTPTYYDYFKQTL